MVTRRMYRARVVGRCVRRALRLAIFTSCLGNVQAGQLDAPIGSMVDRANSADEMLGEKARADYQFLAVPVPIVDPTLGRGLAVTTLLTFPAGKEADTVPRSTIGAGAAYTNNQTWVVGAGGTFYLKNDRYKANLTGGYGRLNVKYYGTGTDSVFFDNPAEFQLKGTAVTAGFKVRADRNFYIGPIARCIDSEVVFGVPVDALPGLAADFDLFGLGLTASYDTRDYVWYPTAGSLGNIELAGNGSHLGFDQHFLTLNSSYARYWDIGENTVLVGDIRAAVSGSNAPFFMLPFVSIRGFPAGRYLDQSVLQAQTELRYLFDNGVGAVAFAGVGVAAPGYFELGNGSDAYGIGGGLRYRISIADKVNVGLDVAYGSSDEVAVYFRIGEAF